MADHPTPIILQTGKQAHHCIIWLHGLGADGQDFVPLVKQMKLPVPVRYIFPHAPMRPVTINGGFMMRAWYDIVGQSINMQQDAAGIRASQLLVDTLIAEEIAQGIAPQNIFLAGFSQGGAIALHTALRHAAPLGGVLALSTYLPLAELTAQELLGQTRATEIFMAHGRNDPVVPYALGVASKEALQKLGYTVMWHEYSMQHAVCESELSDINAWLRKKIAE